MELLQVQKPARYFGSEWNAVLHRNEKRYSFAIAFPDVYEVAQSCLGIKILYDIINNNDNFSCERVFAPMPDMEDFLRKKNIALFSLETQKPLNHFDIVGFTLQYEMTYTNILNMLDLGRIPLRSRDRNEDTPLIIAGGPCAFNPESIADFIDVFVIGDGEEVINEILDVFARWKSRKKVSRNELLLELTKLYGIYVPSFYNVNYNKNGELESISPNTIGVPEKISKRVVRNLDEAPFPTRIIVPYIQTIHDRVGIEIFRGCTRGCRFCKAGFIYRPLRERSVQNVERIAEESLKYTGYSEISLLSLSCSDYSRIGDLVSSLTTKYSGCGINLSLPSLRMDNFSLKLADLVGTVRKAGVTFAPEAGSQRLRDVINKNITEDEILETLLQAEDMGWQQVKLYFMIGLPTETQEDIYELVRLSRKILRETKLRLNISVSHFVPQPFTPFQWQAMENVEKLWEKVYYLRDELQNRRIQFNWHDPLTSKIEAIIARGDRRLGQAIEHVFEHGGRFDGWGDHFNYSLWQNAFQETNIDPLRYLQGYRVGETLPWDHIDAGITKEFLASEAERALSGITTQDCRSKCLKCGICTDGIKHMFSKTKAGQLKKLEVKEDIGQQLQKIRLRTTREPELRWISHLDAQRTFEKALRRAEIPVSHTQGYHPRQRISFALPLPLGYTSNCEWIELVLYKKMSTKELFGSLQKQLPQGIKILEVKEIPLTEKAIMSRRLKVLYDITLPPDFDKSIDVEALLEDFLKKREIIIRKKSGSFNIRPLIERLSFRAVDDSPSFVLELIIDQSGGVKPDVIIGMMLGDFVATHSAYHRSEILMSVENKWVLP